MESPRHDLWQASSTPFELAFFTNMVQGKRMKALLLPILAVALCSSSALATTIMVTSIYEPLSLHDTDGDEAISQSGEALQACVMARPHAITGAYPEDLVHAVRTSHKIPTNNDNYQVQEANLMMLTGITVLAHKQGKTLNVRLNVANMNIPTEVDLTSRQVLNLTILAIRKTLEAYQKEQGTVLPVKLAIEGTNELNEGLKDLNSEFKIGE